jgi:hypothetical protein
MTLTVKVKARQSSADHEAVLNALEAKRKKLVARGEKLPEMRRNAAYAAHVEKDADARRALDEVAVEVATHASELASVDDAIEAARGMVSIAQAVEADAERRERAREAMKVVAECRQLGHDLDEAFRVIAERGKVLKPLLIKLHEATGGNFPSYQQLDTLGFSALQTAILSTPWAKQFRPIRPGSRRRFSDLFDGWATVTENRLRPLLESDPAEAA